MLVSKAATLTQVRALGDRVFSATLYDSSERDRDGETIDLASVTAREPITLQIDHDHSVTKTVGTVRDIHVEGQALRGILEFAPANVSSIADQVHRQVETQVTRAVSIGFLGTPTRSSDGYTIWKDVELLELSFVSVPSSPGATVDRKALEAWLGRGSSSVAGVTRADVDEALPAAVAETFAEEVVACALREIEDQTRIVLELCP